MNNRKPDIKLRRSEIADLDHFFRFQLDEEASYLAAFTPKDRTDKGSYYNKYSKLLEDQTVNFQTILIDDTIAGSIAKYIMGGHAEVTYWIEKTLWGRGIGTKALKKFLATETTRPIYARVAYDNFGSQKVLERSGFIKIGAEKGFANARQKEIEEFVYKLDK